MRDGVEFCGVTYGGQAELGLEACTRVCVCVSV